MCKRCSELEIEIEAAEEYGFGFTSFQLQEELEALQTSHLPSTASTRLETGVSNADSESTPPFQAGNANLSPTTCKGVSCKQKNNCKK